MSQEHVHTSQASPQPTDQISGMGCALVVLLIFGVLLVGLLSTSRPPELQRGVEVAQVVQTATETPVPPTPTPIPPTVTPIPPTFTPVPTATMLPSPTTIPPTVVSVDPTGVPALLNQGSASAQSISYDPALVEQGKQLFMLCSACHGPDARGLPNLGKDLVKSEFAAGLTDEELLAFIKTGRPMWDALNTTGIDMPPKGGNPALKDEEIMAIIAYVRTLEKAG